MTIRFRLIHIAKPQNGETFMFMTFRHFDLDGVLPNMFLVKQKSGMAMGPVDFTRIDFLDEYPIYLDMCSSEFVVTRILEDQNEATALQTYFKAALSLNSLSCTHPVVGELGCTIVMSIHLSHLQIRIRFAKRACIDTGNGIAIFRSNSFT